MEASNKLSALITEKGLQKLVEEIFRTLDSALIGWDDQFNQVTEESKQAATYCNCAIVKRNTYKRLFEEQLAKQAGPSSSKEAAVIKDPCLFTRESKDTCEI